MVGGFDITLAGTPFTLLALFARSLSVPLASDHHVTAAGAADPSRDGGGSSILAVRMAIRANLPITYACSFVSDAPVMIANESGP
jgi:hypothetical protein